MLVLSRSLGQKLHLFDGDTCIATVSIQDIDRGRVRVGIIAPADVVIVRGECLNVEQREAAEKPQ